MQSDFTPAETCKWLEHTWQDAVRPQFKELRKIVSVPKAKIPSGLLVVRRLADNTWNPLFRFLRPATVDSIMSMLSGVGAAKAEKLRLKVLEPYVHEWDGLAEALGAYYGDNTVSGELVNRLGAVFRIFRNAVSSLSLDPDLRAVYVGEFNSLCDVFGRLPDSSKRKFDKKHVISDGAKKRMISRKREIAKWMAAERFKRKASDDPKKRRSGAWSVLCKEGTCAVLSQYDESVDDHPELFYSNSALIKEAKPLYDKLVLKGAKKAH